MKKPLVIITGASSGIGKSIAEVFSASGYPVGLMARNLREMEKNNLPNSLCQSVDITHHLEFKKAIEIAEEKFGPTDCLINNAGFAKCEEFTKIDHADIERMITLNILGVTNGIEVILPGMQTRKSGTIINISSLADRNARPDMAVYAATKAAVKSLSESLRMDNSKHGVRICNVAPAKILTPLSVSENKNFDKSSLINADDFANIILWIYQQPQSISIRDLVVAPTLYER